MVVFAKKKDGTIEAREFKDGRWYGWNSWGKPPIPGGGGAIDNPACCSWGGNRLDLFVCGSDNQLWHKWIDDKGITHDWESRGGGLSSGPTATALMAKGRIDVFVRAPDRSIWVNTLTEGHTDHGKWSGWKSYGGRSLSGPSACSRVGSLQVFVFGEDGKIWSRSDASEVWHELPPPQPPIKLVSDSNPSCVVWRENTSVFARAEDGSLWVRSWIFNPFHGRDEILDWKSWGGISTTGPSACYIVNGPRVDVFVRGKDNAIWHLYGNPQFDNKDTVIMENLSGEWDSGPSAVTMGAEWIVVPPPTPTWNRASYKGIEIDGEKHAWNAGCINDLLLIKSGAPIDSILAASAYSGVWTIDEAGIALCKSEDWDNPDVNCLAFASEDHSRSARVFAGCAQPNNLPGGALYVSDNGIFNTWQKIPSLDTRIGTIFEIAVWKEKEVIILACWGGIFWSRIPPQRGGAYKWHSAIWKDAGLSDPNKPPVFFSVTLAQNSSSQSVIFAGAYNGEIVSERRGIFVGTWKLDPSGSPIELSMSVVDTSSTFDRTKMRNVSVASCENEPKNIYALSLGDSPAAGRPNGVLRSKDGGSTWSLCKTKIKDRSEQITEFGDDSSGGILHKISVDPWNPKIVAFGVIHPFVSFDGGEEEWRRLDKWEGNLDTHSDIHKILIVNDSTFQIASDGGIAKTNNAGSDFFSYFNRYLSNLLFYSTWQRVFYGRLFASYQFPGLVGGGLQDNSNVYADLGYDGMWKKVIQHDGSQEGGDGGQLLSLRVGKIIIDQMANDKRPRVGTWNPSERTVKIDKYIEVKQSSDGTTSIADSLPWTAMEIVNNPQYYNKRKQLMYAVGITHEEVTNTTAKAFGLFANSDGSDIHWEPIIDPVWKFEVDHSPTALGTGDGKDVFFATRKSTAPNDIKMYRLTPSDEKAVPVSLAGIPPGLPSDGVVTRLIVQSNRVVYAAYGLYVADAAHPYGKGYLLKTTDGGTSWVRISGGLPEERIYGLDDDWTTSPKTLYVSTDDKVYVSRDEGRTWQDFSQGLPRRAHCGDLRFVIYPDKKRHLFLGTWGQSLWQIELV